MDGGRDNYLKFLSGDDEGIVSIVGEYRVPLTLFLTGFTGNVHIAEELAEDTFFRLITKKPRFNGKSSFKTWLYAIGRNVAADYMRKNKSVPVSQEDIDEYLSDCRGTEEVSEENERKFAVHKAMSKLNPEYRQVLWLSYFEGLTGTEICSVLKKSNRQTVNLLYNAKKALKAKLTQEGFHYEE